MIRNIVFLNNLQKKLMINVNDCIHTTRQENDRGKGVQLVMDKLHIEVELFVLAGEHQENPNYLPQKRDPRLSATSRKFQSFNRRGSASKV